MQIDDILKLHKGDQIRWNDPDNDLCSRVITIGSIEYNEDTDIIRIIDIDGGIVDAFNEELS